MCDPKSLVQSGDFVEDVQGKIYVAIQRGDELILTAYNEKSCSDWNPLKSYIPEIKKIIRMHDGLYNLGWGLRGELIKNLYKVIYEKQDVLELTVKQIEEKFGCKVKIVKES